LRSERSLRGFTLLEVLVATVVLAVGLLAILTAFSMATRATGASTNDTLIPMLAEQKLAEVRAMPRDDLLAETSEGDFGEEYPGYTWDLEVSPPDDLHVIRVELTIHAAEMGRKRDVKFATDIF
jgi:general secretion pathway protein I